MNMFWELLEAVSEIYDRFSGIIKFGPVKEILKTGCHIYILMKEVIVLGKWGLSLHQRKKVNMFTSQSLFIIYSIKNRKSRSCKSQKQPLEVFCEKMSQSSQETPAPEEISVNFAKFLRTSFLQNNSGWLLLIDEARDIDSICYRELDAML